jgi:hypothetical protein
MESTRRTFLQMSLLAALNAYSVRIGHAEKKLDTMASNFSQLQELPPGAITSAGWLQRYLDRQAGHLGYALPDISWPFTEPFWAGTETTESWWPWEQNAYWIDGAVRLALVTGNQSVLQRALDRIQFTLTHKDGSYLGPRLIQNGADKYHRWPHAIFFRALTALSDHGTLENIPETLSAFYLSDPDDYGEYARNVVNVETMLWCYARTGDKKLLSLAEESWRRYVNGKPGDPADLNNAAVYGAGPINAHGVTYAEISKLPAILYMNTGNPEYLKFAVAGQKRIFDHHMLVDGVPSTSEYFRTTTAIDSHETCDITDHTWTWGYLLKATGDSVWGDRIERACFNAGMGAIHKDWKSLQYFSCPNQVLATMTSNHNPLEPGNYWMAYQPNPGWATACCAGNIHRLFPNYALRMWMASPRGGVAAVLYGASTVEVRAGKYHVPVKIVQETNYPFEESIRFTIQSERAVEFPLHLRIPSWCAEPRIEVNGSVVPMPEQVRGFATLARRFKSGDKVTLHLPMQVKTIDSPQNGVTYECGPLVYSYAIETNRTSHVEPKWSTEDYPSWVMTAKAPWNYGLPVQKLPKLVRSKTVFDIGSDPWITPPSHLEVEAQQVEGWVLAASAVAGGDGLTPSLPEKRTATSQRTRLRLVPLGSTELRITVFPRLA